MKLLTISIYFIFIFQNMVPAQWIVQDTSHNKTLYCVYFSDENNGWICGDQTISRTTNSGLDWFDTGNNSRLDHVFYSMSFADADSGYACGVKIIPDFDPTLTKYLPSYAKTGNCGDSWTFPTSWGSSQGRWRGVCFVNDNTGWLAGYMGSSGVLYKTTSGINNFDFQSNFLKQLFSCCFIDESNGWVCGKDGYISRTTDGGESWNDLNTETELNLYSVKFIDSTYGFAVGYKSDYSEGIVLRTTDGGENWQSQILQVRMLNSVFIIDKDIAWISGSEETTEGNKGIILYSSNGGSNWETQYTSETSSAIYSIHFIDASFGWAVGASGEILKTTTGGITSIHRETSIITSFNLSQNYPNPFNPTTTIKYSVIKESFVTIKIYNVLGKEINTLVNEKKSAGNYSVNFNGSNLPSGIYFYRMKAGNFVSTKKFVLLK